MNAHLFCYNALAQRGHYAEALQEPDQFITLYPHTPAASRMRELREDLARAAHRENR
jgi:hypothetical protein